MKFEQMTLDDILTFKRGHDLPHSQRVMGSVPVVSSSGITGYHDQYIDDGEGVITGRYGTLGEIHYVNGKYWPLNTTLYVTDFKNNFPKFIYYFLKTIDFEGANSAGAVPGINRNNLKNIVVRVPCTSTQKKIASILSNYDDLIQTNQQRIKLLEEAAQRLYDEWFVKLRFPNHEQVPVVDGVPEGWEKLAIDNIFTLQRGFDLPNNQRKEGSTPVYASTGLNGFHDQAMVDYPTVITGRSGSLGQVLYSRTPCWPLNTTLWVKDFKRTTPIHAFFLLKGLGLEGLNGGSAVPTLNRNDVHRIQIVAPNLPLILVFDQKVKPIFDQVDILSQQNQKLMQARDDLLPRLMSGRLDVSTLSAVGEE